MHDQLLVDDSTAISTPTNLPRNQRKPTSIPSQCAICGGPALYKYFGVKSCHSCKIFFKRNAELGPEAFKCNNGGQCDIDVLNGRRCTSCRLTKCFANGMSIELIRCARQNKQSTETLRQIHVTSISNILTSDPSQLTIEQWNFVSKLSNSYQDHQTFQHVQQFIQEQISRPIKLRYKLTSVSSYFESILTGFEFFFQTNDHLCALHLHDRSLLLRCAMENAGNFIAILLLLQAQLFDHPYIRDFMENIYGSLVITVINHLLNQIDCDATFIKLSIALFTLSPTSSTNVSSKDWQNFNEIIRIQNLYVEMTWKYLLRKYDHSRAVICFDHLIKTILRVHTPINELQQSQQYRYMIDNLVAKIHRRLIVSESMP